MYIICVCEFKKGKAWAVAARRGLATFSLSSEFDASAKRKKRNQFQVLGLQGVTKI